jgi:hypothetical protein
VETRWSKPDQAVQPGDGGLCGRTVGGERRQRPAQPFFADFGSFPLHKNAHQVKAALSFPRIMSGMVTDRRGVCPPQMHADVDAHKPGAAGKQHPCRRSLCGM